jgi:hypothetical protein
VARLVLISALLILGAAAAVIWPDRQMRSRDLGCAAVGSARGQEICAATSESMQWTWFGHAIVSPGWRPTPSTLRDVYCRQPIAAADLPVLDGLAQGSRDWRLQSTAEDLARILRNIDGRGGEPENSMFHPQNPGYILRGGCR